jgi:heme oxygenase
MMRAIHSDHEWGNKVRMLKLPLILTDDQLYARAIAQFYRLTKSLEDSLQHHKVDPLVSRVLSLGYDVTPGYEADLKQLLGTEWKRVAEEACTSATIEYCSVLESASPEELVAASFILYGALVIGGGKNTQKKVKKVFPRCEHQLFDVADDIIKARGEFKKFFNTLGTEMPEHADSLVQQAARFMSLNNTVVLSVRCLPFWWWKALAVSASLGAILLAMRWRRTNMVTV